MKCKHPIYASLARIVRENDFKQAVDIVVSDRDFVASLIGCAIETYSIAHGCFDEEFDDE